MHLVRNKSIYYPKLSYQITGLLFGIHNELGKNKTERQYCDYFEEVLKNEGISYIREKELSNTIEDVGLKGNIPDFIIENKIVIDFKTKRFLLKDDYYQMLRYLDVAKIKLGMIVNFRTNYLKPKRIINPKFNPSNPKSSE